MPYGQFRFPRPSDYAENGTYQRYSGFDPLKIAIGIIGKVLVHIGMDHVGAARPKEEHVIVLGVHHGADREEAVTARLAFDDNRLFPDDLQLVGQ